MTPPALSEQELVFVQEYAKDKNGVRAALAAGLSPTYFGANDKARSLLQKPAIKHWLKKILRKQAKALKFKPSRVLRNWMLAATADLTYFVITADGKLDTAPGVPKEYLRAVRKWKTTKSERLGKDNVLVVETKAEMELRDPFGPECKLMEHFGELKGEDKDTANVELAVRLAALLGARQHSPGGVGQLQGVTEGGGAVAAQPGAAVPGVPERSG